MAIFGGTQRRSTPQYKKWVATLEKKKNQNLINEAKNLIKKKSLFFEDLVLEIIILF